jgi:hypothetical protein
VEESWRATVRNNFQVAAKTLLVEGKTLLGFSINEVRRKRDRSIFGREVNHSLLLRIC